MKRNFIITFSLLFTLNVNAEQCSNFFSQDQLTSLRLAEFVIDSAEVRNTTAVNLLACIGEQNPKVRDETVYSGLSKWLRGKELTVKTTQTLFNSLIKLLKQPNIDKNNFTQPFAALVLSEVVRVDRVTPYLTTQERQEVVDVTSQYMQKIEDYRGFNDNQGWRHSVAHTADVMLQLALNPEITKTQLDQLLVALTSQVSAKKNHAYIYGEPKRLALPFLYIVLRGLHSTEEIASILEQISQPSPFQDWQSGYKSNKGLAHLHNTKSFLTSLYVTSSNSKNELLVAIQPALEKALKSLP